MRHRKRRLLATLFSFGAIQAGQIALPFLALPYLARVLGPDAFGLLMYFGVFSIVVGLVLEWGFTLGASREVAANRGCPYLQGETMGDVLGAKALLAMACVFVCLLCISLVPNAAAHPDGFLLAVLAGCVRGCSPAWFFQGRGEGMPRMAMWDAGSGVAVLAATFILVREPSEWPVYLLLQAACKGTAYAYLIASFLGHGQDRKDGGTPRNGMHAFTRRSLAALRRHWALFASGLAALVYTGGVQLVLGRFLPTGDMGMLVVADKIARGIVSLNDPVIQTAFPEACALRGRKGTTAAGDAGISSGAIRTLLLWTAGLSLGACGLLALCATILVRIFLGPGYEGAVPVLRSMALLIPPLSCNMVLGRLVLVPMNRERLLVGVQTVAAFVSVPAAILAGKAGVGTAALLSAAIEGGMLVCFLCLSWRLLIEPDISRPRMAETTQDIREST